MIAIIISVVVENAFQIQPIDRNHFFTTIKITTTIEIIILAVVKNAF